ncbi:ribosome maturation factor RimP [Xylanimonas protaetiae]|uniref:Ribosome maturation factor RimP n=1 Tax=Xylanimonas protaetiae TaxID=2509457 RepID=A0A4V0YGA9_9MICO|nr:ribosome maturation factor RimP [Xylanimonas protaetiae]QAY70571.1 ribosome maturation factor RimP [Xylanimonas protaetiae]
MAAPDERKSSPGSATAEAVHRVVAPAVDAEGLYLEAVTVSRAGARSVVRVTVDLPEDEVGSLGSDALDAVSRAISAALDADDVVPGVYVLEVSTPGTSRPLTELRHFRRARTRLVTLTLTDGGEATGRLEDVTASPDGDELLLDDGTRVPVAAVRRGRVEVELKRIDDADLGPEIDDDDAGDARTQEG